MNVLEKKVTWLELFYDLIFVAAVATTTHVLTHPEHGVVPVESLFKYVLMFVPVWWAWVGQTLFINRFGEDLLHQRLFMMIQMIFVLLMTSSLSENFDPYYYTFLIGYISLRTLTALQYLFVRSKETGARRSIAHFLGTRFWIGIIISACSVFFESWVRYAILYSGIVVDIIIPLLGRKVLAKMPVNTAHLLERFALLTLILFGEMIVSTLAVLKPQNGDWNSIAYSVAAFVLILSMWWQYFDSVEKKTNKSLDTVGHAIIYGHLFILMSLSMMAAAIKLLFLGEVTYSFGLIAIYGAAFLFFAVTALIFHPYRFEEQRLRKTQILALTVLLLSLFVLQLLVPVPNLAVLGGLAGFFIVYAWLTTK
ncbi:low temperature requirement protein A [Paenibacillus gansuensis]|uniref:Low temperature requirement protein A n=1 Tax=Paenibacillus gansuensis TaxID=306542 RepID=A0ABW5PLH7_9BACL